MIGWLLATAGTAALGSVFPVVNIELYLLGVLSTVHGLVWWPMALAATAGQLTGKTVFFFAGRGSFTLSNRLGKLTQAKEGSRWSKWLETFHQRTEEKPWWGLGMLLIGAITGIPPFTVMCFLSGAAGIPILGFLGISLAGRAVHFLLVAGAPQLLQYLPAASG